MGFSHTSFSVFEIPSFEILSFVIPSKTFLVLSFSVSCVNPYVVYIPQIHFPQLLLWPFILQLVVQLFWDRGSFTRISLNPWLSFIRRGQIQIPFLIKHDHKSWSNSSCQRTSREHRMGYITFPNEWQGVRLWFNNPWSHSDVCARVWHEDEHEHCFIWALVTKKLSTHNFFGCPSFVMH